MYFVPPNLKFYNQYCHNERLEVVRLGLDRRKVAIFDLKNFLRICYLGLDIIQDGTNDKYFDPKVAAWILKPGENEMTLSTLVLRRVATRCGKNAVQNREHLGAALQALLYVPFCGHRPRETAFTLRTRCYHSDLFLFAP